jgi:hypothetical protein
MDRATTSADLSNTLYGEMQLSKSTWLLASQFPDRPQPSLYPIEAGTRKTWWRSSPRRLTAGLK